MDNIIKRSEHIINQKFADIINKGLDRAAKVIGEFTDSNTILKISDFYFSDSIETLEIFSEHIIIQEMVGEMINGKSIFSMSDNELLKLLEYLEVIEGAGRQNSAEELEMILDTYQEIGNIILGNVIAVVVDAPNTRVEIRLPYLAEKKDLLKEHGVKHIIIDVNFLIEKLNAEGELCLIFNENTLSKIISKIISSFDE